MHFNGVLLKLAWTAQAGSEEAVFWKSWVLEIRACRSLKPRRVVQTRVSADPCLR